ncbi:MarR family winged helix-turn-helix transcriptional regulator [Microbacterium sp.]|uniref:MarR family winged helix-turn-helix transcriptional regulator n=1 Tax=Microbacterium sp. TaxID=51671 RepID=UPI0039E286C2
MTSPDAVVSPEFDSALVELQGRLELIFAKARLLWKDSAARIAPGLHVSGYKLLAHLDRAGECTAHELAQRSETDKSVISRQVRMLEECGLVVSRADERDGRQRVLTATAEAHAALARVRGGYAQRVREAIDDLTVDEIRAATRVFERLAAV